jgi:hypothetical protein
LRGVTSYLITPKFCVMKKLLATALPILEGQMERALKFNAALNGERHTEYKAIFAANGLHERHFLQAAPIGDLVVVVLEGEDPQEGLKRFAHGKDAFTKWYLGEVMATHGVDLVTASMGKMPGLISDSRETITTGGKPGKATS